MNDYEVQGFIVSTLTNRTRYRMEITPRAAQIIAEANQSGLQTVGFLYCNANRFGPPNDVMKAKQILSQLQEAEIQFLLEFPTRTEQAELEFAVDQIYANSERLCATRSIYTIVCSIVKKHQWHGVILADPTIQAYMMSGDLRETFIAGNILPLLKTGHSFQFFDGLKFSEPPEFTLAVDYDQVQVVNLVSDVLADDRSGHAMDHIKRVVQLACRIADREKWVNQALVTLIALLHEVDDRKLFGQEQAQKLTNARRILSDCQVDVAVQELVLSEISRIGYSKALLGIRPETLAGAIISDADLLDSSGAIGIVRVGQFAYAHDTPFFDNKILPELNLSAAEYNTARISATAVNHLFERILRIDRFILVDTSREEVIRRSKIIIQFLENYFAEQEVDDTWHQYLKMAKVSLGLP